MSSALSCVGGGYHYMQATGFYKKVEYLQDGIKIEEQTIQSLQEALKQKKEHANEARKECIV